VAEEKERKNYDEQERVETWNESISFTEIKDRMKQILSPTSVAGMMAAGIEANKPLTAPESEGIDTGTAFKWGMPIVIIIVAIFVVMKMNII